MQECHEAQDRQLAPGDMDLEGATGVPRDRSAERSES